MTAMDAVVHPSRALNRDHLAHGLAALLSAAEANALSDLELVEQRVDLERQGRETHR